MQFSDNLHKIAKQFKETNMIHNYMCAHLRRRDFVYGHPTDVPSIKEAAKQILNKLNKLNNIEIVYVATDASKIGK